MDRIVKPGENRLAKLSMLKLGQQKAGYWLWRHMMAMKHRMASCITVIYFWQRVAVIYAGLIFWTIPARLVKYLTRRGAVYIFILG